jgi:hypothetical protein
MQGVGHPRVSGWLKLGFGPTAPEGAVPDAASHPSGPDDVNVRIIIITHLLGLAPAGSWLHWTTARRAA